MSYDPRAILVVDVAPFGKALLMLPALQALRDKYPQAFISVAAARGIGDLLEAVQLVDETVDLGIVKATEQSYGSAFKRLFQLFTKTRREYDWAIDFSPRLETQIASRLSWRTRHITPSGLANLVDIFIKRNGARSGDHLAECATALKKVGISQVEPRFNIALPNEASLRFEDMVFRKETRHGEPIVVLYSSRAGGADSWGVERFIETAHRLANNFRARIVVLDEPFSNDFTAALKEMVPAKALALAAPTALQFAAALARSSLVITDERGIAKMAADFDAPVIEIADSPSAYSTSGDYRVITSSSPSRVTTEAVFETASELIQAGRTATLLRR
jgi:ADP-heptose:LPS heptosyltransferase